MVQHKGKISARPAKIINTPYRYLIIGFGALGIVLVIIILYFALGQANLH